MTLNEIVKKHLETQERETYFANTRENVIHVMTREFCFYLGAPGEGRYLCSFTPNDLIDDSWFICNDEGDPL